MYARTEPSRDANAAKRQRFFASECPPREIEVPRYVCLRAEKRASNGGVAPMREQPRVTFTRV